MPQTSSENHASRIHQPPLAPFIGVMEWLREARLWDVRLWIVAGIVLFGLIVTIVIHETLLFLLGGFIVTGLLGGYLLLLTAWAARAEQLATRRTAECERFFTRPLDLLCTAGADGYLRRLNPTWEKAFGFTAAELRARPYLDFIHPDDRERAADKIRRLAAGQTVRGFESRFRCKDGTYRLLSWSAVPLEEDGMVYAVAHDITERGRAEAALRKSESRLKAVTDNSAAVIYVKDRSGRYILVNRRYEELFGVKQQDMSGKSDRHVFSEKTAHALRDNDLKVLDEGRPIEFEEVVPRGKREHVYLSVKFPLFDHRGEPYAVCTISTDITERKRAEKTLEHRTAELAQSNADLEEFAYAASHDLRAPLRAIANLSEWIEEDAGKSLTGETLRNMGLLRNRVRRMETLIDDLLTYSRAGRGRSEVRTVDTRDLLEGVIFLLDPPEEFTIDIAPNMPTFSTFKAPLEQVFSNLIGNAIRHHDRPNGRVEVAARDAGDTYEFTVSDDGPGIPPEFHERVFRMFHTLRPRDEVEGSGLGLALVKKLVERHGGTCRVGDRTPRGTTFHFTWPKRSEREQRHGE